MKILLVEDDDALRGHYVRQLQHLGHEVEAYAFVREVCDALGAGAQADLVWVDLMLSDGDGLEVSQTARVHVPAVQILVVSGSMDGEHVLRALRAGVDHFLPKPFELPTLHAVLRRVEGVRGAHRDKVRAWHSFERCDLELCVPADMGVAAATAALLGKHARSFLDDAGCRGFQSAVHELLLNSIEHGCLEITREEKLDALSLNRYSELIAARSADPRLGGRVVRVRLVADNEQGVRITLSDPGPGFDPDALPDPWDPENLFLESGRGITMARLNVAQVAYTDGGRTATITARRDAPGMA
jgi:DNA-binding response OmpR family regulator